MIQWCKKPHSQAYTFTSDDWIILYRFTTEMFSFFIFAVLERWLIYGNKSERSSPYYYYLVHLYSKESLTRHGTGSHIRLQ